MENPYVAPQVTAQAVSTSAAPRRYGGIGRLAYFGIGVAMNVVFQLITNGMEDSAQTNPGAAAGILALALLMLIATFVLVAARLKNIGMSPWWCLLMIVPIANLIVGIRCLICQEGYSDTKKLDTAGKVVLGIILAFIGLMFLGFIVSLARF